MPDVPTCRRCGEALIDADPEDFHDVCLPDHGEAYRPVCVCGHSAASHWGATGCRSVGCGCAGYRVARPHDDEGDR